MMAKPLTKTHQQPDWETIAKDHLQEYARIVNALAALHTPFGDGSCTDCCEPLDQDGDCPTMRIVKGKD